MLRAFKILRTILTSSQRKRGAFIVLLIAVQSILDVFSLASFLPLVFFIVNPTSPESGKILQKLLPSQQQDQVSIVVLMTVLILAFILVKNLVSLAIARSKARYAYDVGANLASRAIDWYYQKNYVDFTKSDFSKEVNLVANYPFAFSTNVILPAATFLSEAMVCVLILTGMAIYDYKILLFLSIILLPIITFYYARKNGLQKVRTTMKEQYPLILKYALQIVEGLVDIKAAAREKFFKKRFESSNEKLAGAFVQDHVIQTSTTRLTEIVAAFIICLLVLYAVLTQKDFQHTILLLSIYASASFRVIPSVNRILHSALQYKTHEHLIHEFQRLSGDKPVSMERPEIEKASFKEKIEIRNISIQYPDRPLTLNSIDLTISKGEKIALTGKSGEGKSTLLLVLLGFLKAERSETFVDGKKVDSLRMLQGSIGYVSQNPFIVDGSLAENIAFGVPAEKIDRRKVLTITEMLDLTELIQQLPEGMDTRIGEKGVKISGGQRQRIAIGRALYTDADILLLDEVTNQVHGSLETGIMNTLNNLSSEGKTIIIVTHKIHDADFFDSIYNLEKGSLKKMSVYS